MNVEELRRRTNESLASTDEAMEEAQVQLDQLSLLEDQEQSLANEEEGIHLEKDSQERKYVTGKDTGLGKGREQKSLGQGFSARRR